MHGCAVLWLTNIWGEFVKHQKEAKMLARSVRVSLARSAKLRLKPGLTAGQMEFLKKIRSELIRADILCESIEQEFAVSHDPLIHLGNV